ncbi:glycophorin-C isoform X2 [Esox lucius]|uniref:glycophorin-C isoform X2 n=1 Tax=Esox lucius TaxID=8010 RepID=UPI000576E6AC|nr:glycophorin-C isoform X2 [Esox lucius]
MENSTAVALNPTPDLVKQEAMTQPTTTSNNMDDGYFDAILGAVIAAVVLVLLCLAVVVIRYMYRYKGTYHTNEAKGTEFAETADAALRGDPALQDAMDESKKEYFI